LPAILISAAYTIRLPSFSLITPQHRFAPGRSVAVVNFGLHDAAYGTLAQYSDLLDDALRAIRKVRRW
jgi:hypothetical protein